MSSAAAEGNPWGVQVFGDTTTSSRRRTFVLASYPVLLVLVILAAFVRYLWVALATYCALLFVLSCVSRAGPRAAAAARCVLHGADGLSAAAIAAVAPAFPYDDDAAAAQAAHGEVAQCAVCIETVKGGEEVRRLPACAHTFHVGCIDMWLDSHATCPVCRCDVVPQESCKEPRVQQLADAPLPPV